MKIVNLVENTEGREGCVPAHGLSFYVETKHHRLLMDTGPSEVLMANAEALGVDLTTVDTVIISHGHYDHTGGILSFVKGNPTARIYIRRESAGEFYADDGEPEKRYIGMDPEIRRLSQVEWVEDDLWLDGELFLFGGIGNRHGSPDANRRLKKKIAENAGRKEAVLEEALPENPAPEVEVWEKTLSGNLVPDDFAHEQCLVIREGDRQVLLSGCAHHGIRNILDRYQEIFHRYPDVVISGFHMMKKDGYSDRDILEMLDTARELKELPTVFYTCHCTGTGPYEVMRRVMGTKLKYIHCGDTVVISEKKRRRQGMKWHRFFAWATVFSFVMTMVTGYRRK